MTLSAVVEDLETLRVELRQERLFLVGHSWGGMLAMAYAAAHPDRVDALILIGPGGPTLEFREELDANLRKRLRPEDLEADQHWKSAATGDVDPDQVFLGTIKAMAPAYFFDRAKGLAFAAQLRPDAVHAQVNALLLADMRRHYDSRPGLRRLNRPVLIVQGRQDPIGDSTADEIHATIPGSVLTYVRRAGHYPWIEQPGDFRRAIEQFLAAE
jgi:proline iminopeptidase